MSGSDDITNLFRQFGGQPSNYQELGRDNVLRQSRERWPMLAALAPEDAGNSPAPVTAGGTSPAPAGPLPAVFETRAAVGQPMAPSPFAQPPAAPAPVFAPAPAPAPAPAAIQAPAAVPPPAPAAAPWPSAPAAPRFAPSAQQHSTPLFAAPVTAPAYFPQPAPAAIPARTAPAHAAPAPAYVPPPAPAPAPAVSARPPAFAPMRATAAAGPAPTSVNELQGMFARLARTPEPPAAPADRQVSLLRKLLRP